jgi:type I restriction enzyme M protein
MQIHDILKDTNYKLTQFKPQYIDELNKSIEMREQKNGLVPYIICKVREKAIKLTPEEIVRQLFLLTLHNDYGYPYSRMQIEYTVHFGRETKRADIVIMDKIQPTVPYIVIEVKKPT